MLRRAQTISSAPRLDPEDDLTAWRAEVERTMAAEVENRRSTTANFRPRVRSGGINMRLVLVAVALVAGGLAAYLVLQDGAPSAPAPVTQLVTNTEVVPEAKVQILVAKKAIGIGQRLSPTTVEWADWPEGAVRPEFVTIAADPEAITEMEGDIARFEFFPGEPIRTEKLARAEDGYLSAVLDSGKRGVSVSVAAESASGGFIVPNDHVDVVLTRDSTTMKVSETILANVRVLAINTRLGEAGTTGAPEDAKEGEGEDDPRAEIFSDEAIATLELDPSQAEVIINSAHQGKLSLVLRPLVDVAQAVPAERTANQAIRISSPFWAN